MREKNNKILRGLAGLLLIFFLDTAVVFPDEVGGLFTLCPLRVGQYAEYQIVSFENQDRDNRYRVAVSGTEILEGREYFWIQLDIIKGSARQITLKALTAGYDQAECARKPAGCLSEGIFFLFRTARRIILIDQNDAGYEISPEIFSAPPDILRGTLYSATPDEQNYIDYTKMTRLAPKENIAVPAGTFDCDHFQVETQSGEDFTAEGLDVWRSPDIPFLGVVKMEFSKTNFAEKWKYHYEQQLNNASWWSRLHTYFFVRRVPEKERQDTYVMTLVGYGTEKTRSDNRPLQ
ncbi:MAG: hypothetical protein PHO30_05890 [Candidatus Omnitrophica bacterium]|nr:hypothetical protein [Candidatus Omnitrophota bacterium]